MKNDIAKISQINRLRMNTDGDGITTLIAFYGCPLHCKYCINEKLYNLKYYEISVESLYKRVLIDDLYFQYTNGGLCFGGHEPLLQAEFIHNFIDYIKSQDKLWKFTIETSLNCGLELLNNIINDIDYFIVDIKDMNTQIYKKYTDKYNRLVLKNLEWLISNKSIENIKVRVPYILDYNNKSDIEYSIKVLKENYGLNDFNIDLFDYKV